MGRVFVATWNVAGKSPPGYLNLEDWLHTSPPADIYVLGYVHFIFISYSGTIYFRQCFWTLKKAVRSFWISGFKKLFL